MPSNQSSNYNPKGEKKKKRKNIEEYSRRKDSRNFSGSKKDKYPPCGLCNKSSHVKKTFGIVGSQYVIIARSPVTWRSIVIIKISIKQTLLKNIIRSNVYSMLIKNLIVEKEIGT